MLQNKENVEVLWKILNFLQGIFLVKNYVLELAYIVPYILCKNAMIKIHFYICFYEDSHEN